MNNNNFNNDNYNNNNKNNNDNKLTLCCISQGLAMDATSAAVISILHSNFFLSSDF